MNRGESFDSPLLPPKFPEYQCGKLFNFDDCALGFQLGLRISGSILADTFDHVLGCAFDQILGFFQAEAGEGTHNLNDVDLLRAAILQDDSEFGLFFNRFSRCSRWLRSMPSIVAPVRLISEIIPSDVSVR